MNDFWIRNVELLTQHLMDSFFIEIHTEENGWRIIVGLDIEIPMKPPRS